MKYLLAITTGLVMIMSAFGQGKGKAAGWTTIFDGKNLDNWTMVGTANWKLADGAVQADMGSGHLVSKNSYKDFELRAEFWVDAPANSGIFIRSSNPQEITADNAYEVNVYDTRPDQTYATGSIVNVAPPLTPMKAAGKWNTFEITARGPQLTVILNGTKTVDVRDTKHADGRITLQYGAGVVKFRKVEIRPL
jgi:hypothetical protein